ncbi:hypothetical protein BKA93DRAFT_605797 [Sparassis latifolia]
MLSVRQISLGAVLAAVAGAQLVAAQSLSSQCQSTLASLVTSSDANCLDLSSLAGLIVTNSNTSVIGPVNNWLTGLCAQPACNNATLTALVGNVTSGCSSDLQSLGLSSSQIAQLPSVVQEFYPTVRKILCLSDTSNNNTLCATETLTNIQPYTGTLTPSNIKSLISQIAQGSIPNVPSNVTCTDCTQAAFDVFNEAFPNLVTSGVNGTISNECGASFLSSPQPATVSQTASNEVSSSTSNSAFTTVVPVGSLFAVASCSIAVTTVIALLV